MEVLLKSVYLCVSVRGEGGGGYWGGHVPAVELVKHRYINAAERSSYFLLLSSLSASLRHRSDPFH